MAKERVQVQGLGDVAPGIQPTIQRAGQYGIQVQRAGRNKLMDLADALSQVNPMLAEYGNIRRIQREKRQAFEKAMLAEGEKEFQLDPTGATKKIQQFEQQARRLAESGELPEEANAIRIVGAMRAKAKVLANRDYRSNLLNPEVLLQTQDPEVEILKQREAFLERPEFQSPLVRDSVLEHLFKVEDEFRNKVQDRLDQVDIEDGRRYWLESGRDSINQVISGGLDINSPEIINWINDPAGIFKGSRKFAWDNLISETMKEGLSKDPSEEGSISPQQAETFLDNLRTLDLGGGIKYADAEVGKGITEFYNYIDDRRSKWESKKSEQYNREYMGNLAQAETEILELMGDSDTISPTDEARIKRELREKTPLHLKTKVNKDINDLLGELRKPSTESTQLSVANFELLIDEGDDLDKTLDSVMKAAADRAITPKERNALIQRIESSRNFTKLVYDDPVMKTLRNGYRETITGFEQFKAGKSAGIPVGFFTRLGVSTKLQVESLTGEGGIVPPEQNFGVYYQILRSLSKDAADMFVNKRYVAFERDLRQAFEGKFNELEQDEETSPQEAKAKILEQMESISEKVFKTWSEESITLAINNYKVNPALFDQDLEAQ